MYKYTYINCILFSLQYGSRDETIPHGSTRLSFILHAPLSVELPLHCRINTMHDAQRSTSIIHSDIRLVRRPFRSLISSDVLVVYALLDNVVFKGRRKYCETSWRRVIKTRPHFQYVLSTTTFMHTEVRFNCVGQSVLSRVPT